MEDNPMAAIAARTENNEAGILKRLIRPSEPTLTARIAKAVLSLEFDASDRQRMHELALKAQAGTLTAREQREIEIYRRLGLFVSLLKSKARRSLKEAAHKNQRKNGRAS
jgi:hypothetical protein